MPDRRCITKIKGQEKCPHKQFSFGDLLLSSCGCFLVIVLISALDRISHQFFIDQPLFVAPVGASAVMIFGLPDSDYAQPRNVVGGHFFSALCGVTAGYFFPDNIILASALAVALAMAAMYATGTIHPPGGATALLAVIGDQTITSLGYSYAFIPCLSNALILVFCGIVINNFSARRSYPKFW